MIYKLIDYSGLMGALKRLIKSTSIITIVLASLSIIRPAYSQDDIPEPAPRNAQGRILLDAQAGETNGLWVTSYSSGLPFF